MVPSTSFTGESSDLGGQKEVSDSGTSLTIQPSGNVHTWTVQAVIDTTFCNASVDFTGDFVTLLHCLKLVGGSIVAVRSWKTQVHKGMRFVKHNGAIIPQGTTLASRYKGMFAFKEGVVLSFVRPMHPEIVPEL